MAAHLVVGYFYVVMGLVTPVYVLVPLLMLWVALFVAAMWLLPRRPVLVLAIPLAAAAVLVGVVAFGGAVLGWTA